MNAKQPHWNPQFFQNGGYFAPLANIASNHCARYTAWPELADYQSLLDTLQPALCAYSGQPLRFVEQSAQHHSFEQQYEPRIFLRGEIQTRRHNWHDFFQVLVWCTFPETKRIINARHFEAARQRVHSAKNTPRTPLENALTLFDECGAVVLSCETSLLDLIRNFSWKALFWRRRQNVINNLRCIVFGHAMYEKALNPYIGMTAPSLLITVDKAIINAPFAEQRPFIDAMVAEIFASNREPRIHPSQQISSPQDLSPFPLLGMPGWWADNEHEWFYDNTDYFRPGRKQNPT